MAFFIVRSVIAYSYCLKFHMKKSIINRIDVAHLGGKILKKTIITGLLTLVCVAVAIPAFASVSPQVNGGMEIVDNYTTVVETKDSKNNGMLRLDSSAAGGGWWRRGKDGNRNVSEYQHYSHNGKASCENGNGTFHDGGWQRPNAWSKASVGWTIFGGNKAYYNHN